MFGGWGNLVDGTARAQLGFGAHLRSNNWFPNMDPYDVCRTLACNQKDTSTAETILQIFYVSLNVYFMFLRWSIYFYYFGLMYDRSVLCSHFCSCLSPKSASLYTGFTDTYLLI